jgi:hypothetical protein
MSYTFFLLIVGINYLTRQHSKYDHRRRPLRKAKCKTLRGEDDRMTGAGENRYRIQKLNIFAPTAVLK